MIKEFSKEYNIVYVNCHETAIDLGFKIYSEDINSGVIKFKVPWSLFSFGEEFQILITKKNDSKTMVEVASEGTVGLQIIDWGKNNKNINNFFETITQLLKK